MGGAPVQKFGSQQLVLSPEQQQQLTGGANTLIGQVGNFGQQANAAAGHVNTNFTQMPASAGSPLDSFSQSLLSLSQQDSANKLGAVNNQINSQFAGANPGLAGVLRSQAAMQSQLGQNPAMLGIAAAQNDRQMQQQTLGNAAIAQKLQLQSLPMEQQQSLLQTLGALAALTGTQKSYETPPGARTISFG